MLSEIELYAINKAKELRIKNQMSQADLAFQLGVSYGFIGHVESASMQHSKYNLNHINQLAKIFSVSPREFLPPEPLEESKNQ